ncbi:MAG TPA: amino acid adenylation domain-containing protein, partial [Thermoanaerobaculia bacterium]|nr:amino acid adenylation domain-containing protein [Thermoanaerobaculia bacterium]
FNVHHIVADGWSLEVLVRELRVLYGAFARGAVPSLPEPALQPADVAAWHAGWWTAEREGREIAYWRQRLDGLAPLLALPTDRPRPAVQSFRGAAQSLVLASALVRSLRELGRQGGVTFFMLLLAAFAELLRRYTGQADVAVGSPSAGRSQPGLLGLFGLFVNLLVLRVDLGGDPVFPELLGRVRETALAAYAHQELPFEKLVEALEPERDLGRNPVVQVSFSVDRMELDGALGDLTLRAREIDNGTAKFDLSLYFLEEGEDVRVLAEHATDLFDGATVGRLLANLTTLLHGIAQGPERRLSALPVLAATEREQLLSRWNETASGMTFTHPLALFERQVARAPQALAVAVAGRAWTYAEIDRWASGIAQVLRRERGSGPEAIVGVCLKRSAAMVAAILGVVKAGGAYLPLDPSLPVERLAQLLSASGAVALLARPETAGRLAEALAGAPRPLSFLDPEAILPLGMPIAFAPALGAEPERLVYVIYTSGSTGRPKGVEIPAAGLANLIAWHQGDYRISPADRATLLAGPAFDASVWELWPHLTAGASLHVPDEETRLSPARLRHWIAEERLTVVYSPTPLAEAILALPEEWPAGLPVRSMLVGGDQLHQVPAGLPFTVVNHYGPTEGSVVATGAPVDTAEVLPSIGRPIPNVRVYLLDREMQPVPLGAAGELYLAGTLLARGYHGEPAVTAASFLPDPFGAEPGGRLYRTGDLVRYRPDGQLDFLGRIDHQVKVRGFRVELGEIEVVLAGLPGVREAVVVARESGGEVRLAAYVVAAAGARIAAAGLRERLRAKLPDYMVPAAFVQLAAFPQTSNGKIDRRA